MFDIPKFLRNASFGLLLFSNVGWAKAQPTLEPSISKKLGYISILSISPLISTASLALPSDREKIVELSANSADLNQQTHRGEYVGEVQLDQGSTHLRAAKAVTKGNKQNKLILAVISGNDLKQAHYWTQTAADKPLLHAYANTIYYYPTHHLIKLIGNARVSQGDNSFTAPIIRYDTLNQHVLSKSDGKTGTMIIIHPRKQL